MELEIKRGEIYYIDLNPVIGSEQGGYRPVLVLQNNIGNKFSPTVIVAIITSRSKNTLPTHVKLPKDLYGLLKDSVIAMEQLKTVDKQRIGCKIGWVDAETMKEVDKALKISLSLED